MAFPRSTTPDPPAEAGPDRHLDGAQSIGSDGCLRVKYTCSDATDPVGRFDIAPNTPLRLSDALKLAFPAGGMTVSGLRREIKRGRLEVEIIAGKQFTTLNNIERMRKACLIRAKAPHFTSEKHDSATESSSHNRSSSSNMATVTSPQDALRARLKKSRFQKPGKR